MQTSPPTYTQNKAKPAEYSGSMQVYIYTLQLMHSQHTAALSSPLCVFLAPAWLKTLVSKHSNPVA